MLEKPFLPIQFIHDLLVDTFFDAARLHPARSQEYLEAAEVLFNHALWFTRLLSGAKENGGKISPEDNSVLVDKLIDALRAMWTMGFLD